MCRYGVGARRLGAMTRLEILIGPLGLASVLRSFYIMFDYDSQDGLSGVLLDPTYLGPFSRTVFPRLITLEDEIPRE